MSRFLQLALAAAALAAVMAPGSAEAGRRGCSGGSYYYAPAATAANVPLAPQSAQAGQGNAYRTFSYEPGTNAVAFPYAPQTAIWRSGTRYYNYENAGFKALGRY